EKLRQLDGNLEAIEMLLPRLVDLHLPDGRTDRRDAHSVCGEFRFNLPAQVAIEIEHVDLVDAAQLKMRNAILPADPNLLIQLRRNLISKCGKLEHGVWHVGVGARRGQAGETLVEWRTLLGVLSRSRRS